jgi:hypothetical protein
MNKNWYDKHYTGCSGLEKLGGIGEIMMHTGLLLLNLFYSLKQKEINQRMISRLKNLGIKAEN